VGTYGQDWSSFQSSSLPTAGLGFVIVKQTEGLTYTNPNAAAQVAHARANRLVVGHYHYPHMANSAPAEAKRFLTVARPASGDFLVLDWEGYDKANKGVPFSTQVAYKKAWLAHVQAALPQVQTGTYANTDYLNRDPNGAYGDFLWIATANRPAGQPGITHKWLFHQYGAAGIDRDYCPLPLAELKAWTHAKETPEDDNMPTADEIARAVWNHTETAQAGSKPVRMGAALGWMDVVHGNQNKLLAQAVAEAGALKAVLVAMQKDGGLTAEQAEAAGKAGAQAALAELGNALTNANPAT
jgi:hypothetical protein